MQLQSAGAKRRSDELVVVSRVESVEDASIGDRVHTLDKDKVNLITGSAVGHLPRPLLLRSLFEERVCDVQHMLSTEVNQLLITVVMSTVSKSADAVL